MSHSRGAEHLFLRFSHSALYKANALFFVLPHGIPPLTLSLSLSLSLTLDLCVMCAMEFDLENPLAGAADDTEYPANPNETKALFAAESEHMSSIAGAFNQLSARRQALSFIFQARCRSNLDPSLAYLAVNYADRFLAKREIQSKKPWIVQLLAASCLFLASKMRKSDISLSNFQQEEGFIFDAETIHRMEVTVLAALEWRMRSITPFSFLRFFLLFVSPANPALLIQSIKDRASQIIFKSQNDDKILEFKPSVIAAAALLSSAYQPSFRCSLLSCEYLDKDDVAQCCVALELSAFGMAIPTDGCDSEMTPVTVLDRLSASSESERTVGSASNAGYLKKRRSAAAADLCGAYQHDALL